MIRVLRVLEYTYADGDTMARDMEHWAVGANRTYKPNSHLTIRSSMMLPEHVEPEAATT